MLYQDQLRYANLYADPAQQFLGGYGLPSGLYAQQFPGGYGGLSGLYSHPARQGLWGQAQQFAAGGPPFNDPAQQPFGSTGYPALQGQWGGAQPFGPGEPFANPAQSSYGSAGIFSHPAQQGPWESKWSFFRPPPAAQRQGAPANPAQQQAPNPAQQGLLVQAGYQQPAPAPVNQQQAQNSGQPSGPYGQIYKGPNGEKYVWTRNGWVRLAYDPNDPLARRRLLAEALLEGAGDTSAIQHPLQTAARLFQGVAGAVINRRIREEEEKRKAELEAQKNEWGSWRDIIEKFYGNQLNPDPEDVNPEEEEPGTWI